MDWVYITQEAISFIEEEIGNNHLSPQLVAKNVHVSESHFTRTFNILTGFTLSEYIRNRRLCIAGEELLKTNKTVSEIAFDVGYESPEAFSKAFKRFHGVNSSESKMAKLKEFYPLQVKVILTQEKPLTWSVKEKDKFYLNGKTDIVPSDDSNATAALWNRCWDSGYIEQCCEFPYVENIVGVSTSRVYTIKAKCNQPSSDTVYSIEQHKWVVFPCEKSNQQSILRTWTQIYSNWMKKTEYKISELPQLEVYSGINDGYACEIWIAIE